jgi:hypothetical protein
MTTATNVIRWIIRIVGLILIVLGLLFWSGNALALIPIHMLLGIVLVLVLWIQAGLAARAHVNLGFVALAVVWGLIVLILGITQAQLLPGDAHWIIRVLHLLVGMGAIGLAEGLATRIERARTPRSQESGVRSQKSEV